MRSIGRYGTVAGGARMRPALSLQTLTSRLKFRHLVLLDALGRTHNVHLAAQQMNLTQPAATKILQDIEDLFGFSLFERLPRNMQPTDLGQVVIRYAQETLNAAGKFVEELDHRRKGGYGTLLVGATYGVAHLMSSSIMKIKTRRPLLAIRVLERTSDLLLAELEQKTLDLVIGRFTSEHQHNFFDYRDLAATPLCLVVNPQHPLLRETELELAQLISWPWILHPLTTPSRILFEETLAGLGLGTPVNVVETTSIFATLQLLQGSDMIAMLAASAVGDYIRRGIIAQLPISFDRQLEDYKVLTRKGDVLSPAAEEFVDIIVDVAQHEEMMFG
jgi:DNA-binding transcriptional LysR family regulator